MNRKEVTCEGYKLRIGKPGRIMTTGIKENEEQKERKSEGIPGLS